MNSIADSDAYFNEDRLLPQHQAALTLLQGLLADPTVSEVRWLDLACGRGQIIAHLDRNLSDNHRRKIRYTGFDIDNSHSRKAARVADGMGLLESLFEVGEISRFPEVLEQGSNFDFITLTNTVHEVEPARLAKILFHCICMLSGDGSLFLYDMERLPSPELGAVLWTAEEIRLILTTLCSAVGAIDYEPAVGSWKHRTCLGWNVQVKRAHLGLANFDCKAMRDSAVGTTAEQIRDLLDQKTEQTKNALESLTKFGPETSDEKEAREVYLYNLWALVRAQEASR